MKSYDDKIYVKNNALQIDINLHQCDIEDIEQGAKLP